MLAVCILLPSCLLLIRQRAYDLRAISTDAHRATSLWMLFCPEFSDFYELFCMNTVNFVRV
jgi:hypothetical protein